MQVIMGGSKFMLNDKTRYGFIKLNILMQKSKKWKSEYFGDLTISKLSDNDIVKILVKKMEISKLCITQLGRLHDKIAQLYLDIIDEWKIKYPIKVIEIGLKEDSEPQPPNYTPAMSRLKNISWTSYKPDFGGFCHMEPVKRILQLANYPINTFANIIVIQSLLDWPKKPIINMKKDEKNVKDLKDTERIISLESSVQSIENWYTSLCHLIEILITKIDNDISKQWNFI
jgi:hypothetical protein